MSEITSQCPALQIAEKLATNRSPHLEYLFMAAFVDATSKWAMDAGIKFEKYSNSVAISDTKSVKPAQVVRNLHRMAKMLQQVSRNVLASREQQGYRHELVDCLLILEAQFSRIKASASNQLDPSSHPPPKKTKEPHGSSPLGDDESFFILSEEDPNVATAATGSNEERPQNDYLDTVEISTPVFPKKEDTNTTQAETPVIEEPQDTDFPLPDIEQDWDAELMGMSGETQNEVTLPTSTAEQPDLPTVETGVGLPMPAMEEISESPTSENNLKVPPVEEVPKLATPDEENLVMPTVEEPPELAFPTPSEESDIVPLTFDEINNLALPALSKKPDDLVIPTLDEMDFGSASPPTAENLTPSETQTTATPKKEASEDEIGADILSDWQPTAPLPSPPKSKPVPPASETETTQTGVTQKPTQPKKSKRRKLTEVELMIVELSRIYREVFPGIDKVTRH